MGKLGLAFFGAFSVIAAGSAVAQPIAVGGYGNKIIVANDGEVFATYLGTSASFTDLLYLVQGSTATFLFNNHVTPVDTTISLGTFTAGTELLFRLDTPPGYSFYTGPGSRNPDGEAHAAVQADYLVAGTTLVSFEDLLDGPFDYNDLSFSFTNTASVPSDVPEASTWALMVLGFGAVGISLRARRKTTVTFA